jgi:hypothetical protein
MSHECLYVTPLKIMTAFSVSREQQNLVIGKIEQSSITIIMSDKNYYLDKVLKRIETIQAKANYSMYALLMV